MPEDLKRRLREELWTFQKKLSEASVSEALRLLESPQFERLTDQHIREVSEYRPIELDGERFFERAWSRSKEAGAMLGLARLLGSDLVRDDLVGLRTSLRGSEAA